MEINKPNFVQKLLPESAENTRALMQKAAGLTASSNILKANLASTVLVIAAIASSLLAAMHYVVNAVPHFTAKLLSVSFSAACTALAIDLLNAGRCLLFVALGTACAVAGIVFAKSIYPSIAPKDAAQAKASDELQKRLDQAEAAKTEAQNKVAELESQLAETAKKVDEEQQKGTESSNLLQTTQDLLNQVDQSAAEKRSLETKYEAAKKEKEQAEQSLKTANADLASIQAKLKAANADLATARSDVQTAQKERDSAVTAKRKAELDRATTYNEKIDAESELSKARSELAKAQLDLANATAAAIPAQVKKSLEDNKRASADIFKLGFEYDNLKIDNDSLKTQLEEAKKTKSIYWRKISQLNKEAAANKVAQEQLQKNFEDADKRAKELQEYNQKLEQRVQDMEGHIKTLTDSAGDVAAEELTKVQDELAQVQAELKKAQEDTAHAVKSFTDSRERCRSLASDLNGAQVELALKRQQIAKLESRLNRSQAKSDDESGYETEDFSTAPASPTVAPTAAVAAAVPAASTTAPAVVATAPSAASAP